MHETDNARRHHRMVVQKHAESAAHASDPFATLLTTWPTEKPSADVTPIEIARRFID